MDWIVLPSDGVVPLALSRSPSFALYFAFLFNVCMLEGFRVISLTVLYLTKFSGGRATYYTLKYGLC